LEETEFDEDELFDSSKLTSKEVKQKRKEEEKAEFIKKARQYNKEENKDVIKQVKFSEEFFIPPSKK